MSQKITMRKSCSSSSRLIPRLAQSTLLLLHSNLSWSLSSNVFQALALLNLNRFQESESTYKKAIQLQPKGPLAWQVSSRSVATFLHLFESYISFESPFFSLQYLEIFNWSTILGLGKVLHSEERLGQAQGGAQVSDGDSFGSVSLFEGQVWWIYHLGSRENQTISW